MSSSSTDATPSDSNADAARLIRPIRTSSFDLSLFARRCCSTVRSFLGPSLFLFSSNFCLWNVAMFHNRSKSSGEPLRMRAIFALIMSTVFLWCRLPVRLGLTNIILVAASNTFEDCRARSSLCLLWEISHDSLYSNRLNAGAHSFGIDGNLGNRRDCKSSSAMSSNRKSVGGGAPSASSWPILCET